MTFRLLALQVGDDLTAESVAALSGHGVGDAEQRLEHLLDEHLVQQADARRYRLHDLVREYARGSLEEVGDVHGQGWNLDNLGDTYLVLSRTDPAADHVENALTIQRETDDLMGLQFTMGTFGELHHRTGSYGEALRYHCQAPALSRRLNHHPHNHPRPHQPRPHPRPAGRAGRGQTSPAGGSRHLPRTHR